MSRQHFKIGKGISLSPVSARPSDPENGDMIYNSANSQFERYQNGVWGAFGSGSGSGELNFVVDGDAETGVQIFTPYNDRIGLPAADFRPVDGVGGTPTVTSNFVVANPINGARSFLLQKPAGDCQGQGWSISNIAIPLEFRAKPLSHYLAYLVESGTFSAGSNGSSPTDGDVIVYWYDQQNGKVVESSNIKFFANSTTIADTQQGVVQFDSNVGLVRMIIHVASQTTSAFTLKVDSVALSPELVNQGALSTKWFSYTPTFSNLGTVSGIEMFYALEGPNLKVAGRWTNGTVGAGTATFTLPPVGAVDLPNSRVLGVYGHQGSATGELLVWGGSNLIQFGGDNWQVPMSGTQLATSGFTTVSLEVPIVGLGASVKMSEPGDTRPLSVKSELASASGTIGATFNTVTFTGSILLNSHGAWNGTTLVVPYAGNLLVSATLEIIHSSVAVGNSIAVGVYKGANLVLVDRIVVSNASNLVYSPSVNGIVENCKAGDLITIRSFSNGTGPSYTASFTGNTVSISSVGGSQQIAASEEVFVEAENTAGTVIPNTTETEITFPTKYEDSHGSMGASRFTAQRAMIVEFDASVGINNATSSERGIRVYKTVNGGSPRVVATNVGSDYEVVTNRSSRQVSGKCKLNAGEQLYVTYQHTSVSSQNLVTLVGSNKFMIRGK